MKLFLIGPKIGIHKSNFPDFERTAAYWRGLGHTVVSSAELDIAAGANRDYGWDDVHLPDDYISDLFRRDVAELVTCDAVILLEGWQENEECQVMADVASLADMTAFENIGEDNFYRELDDDDFEYEDDTAIVAGSPAFHAIIKNVVDLHNKKSNDYGKGEDPFYNMRASERYGIPAWVSCMIRSDDKSHRIQKAFMDGPESLVNESVIDSFEDKIVYDILALILYRESLDK